MRDFKFKTLTAKGEVCCAGDRPDFPRCDNCREREPVDYRFASAKLTDRPKVQDDVAALGVPGLLERMVVQAFREEAANNSDALEPPDPYADGLAQMKENRR